MKFSTVLSSTWVLTLMKASLNILKVKKCDNDGVSQFAFVLVFVEVCIETLTWLQQVRCNWCKGRGGQDGKLLLRLWRPENGCTTKLDDKSAVEVLSREDGHEKANKKLQSRWRVRQHTVATLIHYQFYHNSKSKKYFDHGMVSGKD